MIIFQILDSHIDIYIVEGEIWRKSRKIWNDCKCELRINLIIYILSIIMIYLYIEKLGVAAIHVAMRKWRRLVMNV